MRLNCFNFIRNIRTIIQLCPCMNSVAVSAEKFKICGLTFPILKPTQPIPCSIFRPYLKRFINVMDFKNTKIINSALDTFTAKLLYELFFLFPKLILFTERPIVFIPKGSLAFSGTKSGVGRLAAIFTNTVLFPSAGKITRAATKFTHTFFYIIFIGIKGFFAKLARCFNFFNITHSEDYISYIGFCQANILRSY
jgi:hypothetical protein